MDTFLISSTCQIQFLSLLLQKPIKLHILFEHFDTLTFSVLMFIASNGQTLRFSVWIQEETWLTSIGLVLKAEKSCGLKERGLCFFQHSLFLFISQVCGTRRTAFLVVFGTLFPSQDEEMQRSVHITQQRKNVN